MAKSIAFRAVADPSAETKIRFGTAFLHFAACKGAEKADGLDPRHGVRRLCRV
jgi:hypothetical protein